MATITSLASYELTHPRLHPNRLLRADDYDPGSGSLNILTCGDRHCINAKILRPFVQPNPYRTVTLIDPGYRYDQGIEQLRDEFSNFQVDDDYRFSDSGRVNLLRRDVELLDWGIDIVLAFGSGPNAAHVIRHAHCRGIEVRRYDGPRRPARGTRARGQPTPRAERYLVALPSLA